MLDFSLSLWVFKLVNTKRDIMTFSVLGRSRSPSGKLQMSFCILKMSFQSTPVSPASKTNLFEKKQIRTPGVCSSVDDSRVTLCFWGPFSPVPAYLCPPGLQLCPGQDKSRVLRDWHGSISLESCSTHPPVSMLTGFSAVCFQVLHHQTHIIAAYLTALGKILVLVTQACSFISGAVMPCMAPGRSRENTEKSEQICAWMQSVDGSGRLFQQLLIFVKTCWPCCIPLHKLVFSCLGSNDSWVELTEQKFRTEQILKL